MTRIQVWQEKLRSPNVDLLTETYNIITDGRGESHKMPTIAEFMSIYKERERLFLTNQNLLLTAEYGTKPTDKDYNRMRVKEIIDTLKGKIIDRQKTHLCDQPHEFNTPELKGRLTRDAHGRDHCYYYDHPKNIV